PRPDGTWSAPERAQPSSEPPARRKPPSARPAQVLQRAPALVLAEGSCPSWVASVATRAPTRHRQVAAAGEQHRPPVARLLTWPPPAGRATPSRPPPRVSAPALPRLQRRGRRGIRVRAHRSLYPRLVGRHLPPSHLPRADRHPPRRRPRT